MSEREVALALFQSISGLSDAKCKEYLQRHNWKTEVRNFFLHSNLQREY